MGTEKFYLCPNCENRLDECGKKEEGVNFFCPACKKKYRRKGTEDFIREVNDFVAFASCSCGCGHYKDFGACKDFQKGANGRCVHCDHGLLCHPGEGPWANGPIHRQFIGKKVTTVQDKMKENTVVKQGRNELCSCGSGKKFKHCCLRK